MLILVLIFILIFIFVYINTFIYVIGNEVFACLACDGLWDVMNQETVIKFIKDYVRHLSNNNNNNNNKKSISGIAKALVKHAFGLGSMDNISVIIVFFNKDAISSFDFSC